MSERTERCDKCKWWEEVEDDDYDEIDDATGCCRRNPPQQSDVMTGVLGLFQMHNEWFSETTGMPDWQMWLETMLNNPPCQSSSLWPATNGNNFCGEFTPKPETKTDWRDFTEHLSLRSRKALIRLGINDFDSLCDHTEAQILKAKWFGETSLCEIKERLAERGLTLRK